MWMSVNLRGKPLRTPAFSTPPSAQRAPWHVMPRWHAKPQGRVGTRLRSVVRVRWQLYKAHRHSHSRGVRCNSTIGLLRVPPRYDFTTVFAHTSFQGRDTTRRRLELHLAGVATATPDDRSPWADPQCAELSHTVHLCARPVCDGARRDLRKGPQAPPLQVAVLVVNVPWAQLMMCLEQDPPSLCHPENFHGSPRTHNRRMPGAIMALAPGVLLRQQGRRSRILEIAT
mmetsp:Transcript_40298/g.106911  ORF Transcript_40298/g.106911 Transcript_40298/m.106911 type:complete len:228 (-) Transcript_40298:1153-1836(-)